ncbi:MAG: hypothetical protein ACK55Z_23965, partial [bacterium]
MRSSTQAARRCAPPVPVSARSGRNRRNGSASSAPCRSPDASPARIRISRTGCVGTWGRHARALSAASGEPRSISATICSATANASRPARAVTDTGASPRRAAAKLSSSSLSGSPSGASSGTRSTKASS